MIIVSAKQFKQAIEAVRPTITGCGNFSLHLSWKPDGFLTVKGICAEKPKEGQRPLGSVALRVPTNGLLPAYPVWVGLNEMTVLSKLTKGSDDLSIDFVGNTMILKCGSKSVKVHVEAADEAAGQGLSSRDYVLSIASNLLLDVMGSVRYAASTDETRPHLASMLLECINNELRCVCTDGHRLAIAAADVKAKSECTALIPKALVDSATKLVAKTRGKVSIAARGGALEMSGEDGSLSWLVRSEHIVENRFPEYRRVMPSSAQPSHAILKLPVCAERLSKLQAVQKAIISSKVKGAYGVHFACSATDGSVFVSREQFGHANERNRCGVPLVATFSTTSSDALGFSVALPYLLEAVTSLDGSQAEVAFNGEIDPVLVNGTKGLARVTAVIMPMRNGHTNAPPIRPVRSSDMTCVLSRLTSTAKFVSEGAGDPVRLPVLGNVLLRARRSGPHGSHLSLACTNLDVWTSASVPGRTRQDETVREALVHADSVAGVLRAFGKSSHVAVGLPAFGEKHVAFVDPDTGLFVDFEVVTSTESFPPEPDVSSLPDRLEISSAAMAPAIDAMLLVVGTDSYRPITFCAEMVTRGPYATFYGTDGHRATRATIAPDATTEGPAVPISRDALEATAKMLKSQPNGFVTISAGDAIVGGARLTQAAGSVRFDGGTESRMVAFKLCDINDNKSESLNPFFDPRRQAAIVRVDRKDLADAVAFADTKDAEKIMLRSADTISLTVSGVGEGASVQNTIAASVEGTAYMTYDGGYLKDLAASFDDAGLALEFGDSKTPMICRGHRTPWVSVEHLLMPAPEDDLPDVVQDIPSLDSPAPPLRAPPPAQSEQAGPQPVVRAPTPRRPTPRPVMPRAPTPRPVTPRAATPRPVTPRAPTPRAPTPRKPTPRPVTPRAPTPKQASPRRPTPHLGLGKDLAFAIKNYRGEVFAEWLSHLYNTTFNHGSELVLLLGTPRAGKPGMTDNVDAADKLLRAAAEEGWIQKASASPTPSADQRFFGIGGQGGGSKNIGYHGSVWGWQPGPNADKSREWLSSLGFHPLISLKRPRTPTPKPVTPRKASPKRVSVPKPRKPVSAPRMPSAKPVAPKRASPRRASQHLLVTDPNALAKLAIVEGREWATRQKRGGIKLDNSFPLNLRAFQEIVAQGLAGLDIPLMEIDASAGVIAGDEGRAYIVMPDGEIMLDGASASKLAAKRAANFMQVI
jgi:DNA polymerase III sliding clamp (beta) subunit (PCNA family)